MFHGSANESQSDDSNLSQQQNEPNKSQAFTNISKATVIMKFIHSGKIRFPTIITIWAEIICVCASHLSWGAPTDLCPKFCAQAKLAFLRPAAHWHLARGDTICMRHAAHVCFCKKFTSKKHQKQKSNHTKPGVARLMKRFSSPGCHWEVYGTIQIQTKLYSLVSLRTRIDRSQSWWLPQSKRCICKLQSLKGVIPMIPQFNPLCECEQAAFEQGSLQYRSSKSLPRRKFRAAWDEEVRRP